MAVLEIQKFPAPILKKKADPVSVFDEDLQKLIDDMIETMYAAPGVGLAAPQVGVSQRLAVIDISSKDEKYPLIVLINPCIERTDGEIEFEEGCLSIPEYTAKIKRSERLIVRAHDRDGREVEIDAGGLLAIALQHEIDHLDGLLLIDRISPIKREFFKKRFKKAQKIEK
jgi:peptide deformylase